MAFVIGLFEDILHVEAVIGRLEKAGISSDEISILSKEHLTKEDSQAIFNKRTSEISGIAGAIGGGYLGAVAGLATVTIPGLGPVVAGGFIAPFLAAAIGGGVGGAAGAYTGFKLVPALMESLDLSEKDAHFFAEAVKREGSLVAVETTEANQAQVEEIMRNSEAVDVKERRQQFEAEGWQGFEAEPDETDTDK